MIYHVLPESEPLSAVRGGALAHTVANLMKLDSSRAAVCPSADTTWGFPSDRVIVVPKLRFWEHARARRFYPEWVASRVLRLVFRRLIFMLREGDILWCHNRPAFAAALATPAKRAGAKLICHFHDGLDVGTARRSFRSFAPDAAIFVSEYMRKFWLELLPELRNTYTVHNGADEAEFYPPATSTRDESIPMVLFVGRLHPTKGVHVLIDAMRILRDCGVPVRCRIVGSTFSGGSKETRYIKNLMASKPSNVTFAGFCSTREIANEYRSADILCCPSLWQEPFGKVNVEAMACGVPVVATRVGGIPEIAAEGGMVLVEPNSATDLAASLQRLVQDFWASPQNGR